MYFVFRIYSPEWNCATGGKYVHRKPSPIRFNISTGFPNWPLLCPGPYRNSSAKQLSYTPEYYQQSRCSSLRSIDPGKSPDYIRRGTDFPSGNGSLSLSGVITVYCGVVPQSSGGVFGRLIGRNVTLSYRGCFP